MTRRYVPVCVAARLLDLSGRRVRDLIAAGVLRAARIGPRGHWRVDRDSISELLGAEQSAESAESAGERRRDVG